MAKFIITGTYAIRKDKLRVIYVPDDEPKKMCLEVEGAKYIYSNTFDTREELLKEYSRILAELEED